MTPEMLAELSGYVDRGESFVCVDHPLPDDWRAVDQRAARGGAVYWLLESGSFADVPASDYPELPRPRLMPQDSFLRIMKAAGSC